MSRGLSKQQKNILAVALHVNKRTNGGNVALKTGQPINGYRVPTVDYAGVKDLNWTIAAHVVNGLEFVEYRQDIMKSNYAMQAAGGYFDLTMRKAKSVKASTIRAITKLFKAGYLLYAPIDEGYGNYVLSQSGIDRASECEPVVFDDWVIFRAGMFFYPQNSYDTDFFDINDLLEEDRITLSELYAAIGKAKLPGASNYHLTRETVKLLKVTVLPTIDKTVTFNH